jgi:hypothetical protein
MSFQHSDKKRGIGVAALRWIAASAFGSFGACRVRSVVNRLAGRIISAVGSALPRGYPVGICGAFASDRAPSGSRRVSSSTKESANLKACFAGFLSLLLLFCPLSAFAEGWDHLPGDRVVITVKDHSFVFPSQGYDLDHIRFNQESLRERATLREVIAAPEKEKEIFAKRESVGIALRVGPDKSLFLNRFDRTRIANMGFGFNVGEDQIPCQLWAKEFDRVRTVQRDEPKADVGLWREFKEKNALVYTYSGPTLNGVRSGLQNIYCDALSYCGSVLCLAPRLAFSFEFSNKVVPQPQWIELLRVVDAILSTIVEAPTDPKGDIR